MELLIKFILGTAGLTWILGKSSIFRGFREYLSYSDDLFRDVLMKSVVGKTTINKFLAKFFAFASALFKCPGCLGAWCGAVVSIYIYHEFDIIYVFIGGIVSIRLIEKYK